MKNLQSFDEFLNEGKKLQIKRQYGQYDATNVELDAPVRERILNYVNKGNGRISEYALRSYIKLANETQGQKTTFNWVKNNSRYLKKFESNGEVHYKLTSLAKRIIKKTTLNEYGPLTGSGNRGGNDRPLVDKINQLDQILLSTKNSKANMEWEEVAEKYLDGDSAEYWNELGDQELQDAIDNAEYIIKKYKIK